MKRCRIYTADGLLVCDGTMKDCAAAIGVTINAFRNYAGGWNKTPGGMQIELSDWPLVYKKEETAGLCPCRYRGCLGGAKRTPRHAGGFRSGLARTGARRRKN